MHIFRKDPGSVSRKVWGRQVFSWWRPGLLQAAALVFILAQARPAQASIEILSLATGPSSAGGPTTLYAGTTGGGVYKSTDGAGTWSDVSLPTNGDVFVLAVDPSTPDTIYAATRCCTDQVGIYKSTDGGGYWQAVNTGLPDFPGVVALV